MHTSLYLENNTIDGWYWLVRVQYDGNLTERMGRLVIVAAIIQISLELYDFWCRCIMRAGYYNDETVHACFRIIPINEFEIKTTYE